MQAHFRLRHSQGAQELPAEDEEPPDVPASAAGTGPAGEPDAPALCAGPGAPVGRPAALCRVR